MYLSGADIISEVLLEHGVDTVFGYPGGQALNIYDSLYKYSDRIHHILTAHEQGACHAADGYARASGKTGVVIATSGPGATNLVTGIATAFMDSVPLVAITGNVSFNLVGRDAFQEIYITGVTMPITKHNFLVTDVKDLADTLRDAFRIANSGRKGPVLVDVTKDATANKCEYICKRPEPIKELPVISDKDAERIAELINNSERPVLYCGGGVVSSDSEKLIKELANKADIPVCYTIMGAGTLSYDDPRSLGLIGMHGTVAANYAVDEADLVIAIGVRFSDRVALNMQKFAKNAVKVHIDADRGELNKNVKVDIGIHSDAKKALEKLLPLVNSAEHKMWNEKIDEWKRIPCVHPIRKGTIAPKDLLDAVCEMTDEDTIYVTDVGQHQMWSAQYIRHKRTRRFITSGGLGTMGFGYGAALGAQLAQPNKRVIHITGDGSFHMNLNEGCTAVSYNLPVITIIFNNKVLGMVYQWQTRFYGKRYSETTPERKTDYVKLAEGFGAKGYRATNIDEFKQCFAEALKEKGPVWIDCLIDREEDVLPMIPGGGTPEDMMTE